MRVLITNGPPGTPPVDYTRYVVDGSLTIEDSINVPTLISFQLSATDSSFVVPRRSAYVSVVSDLFASGTGFGTGKILATGFVTNQPEAVYQGLTLKSPQAALFQDFNYNISVTSDEWILNARTVPFIPAFVNQTDSQILAALANALLPGFFDTTTFMASGTLVPYFQYDSAQTWSDIAKSFGDAYRFHYKVRNRKISYQPFGDQQLGISYDEVHQSDAELYPEMLKTGVLTVPPVNDCIVIGDTEPQDNWDNYFIGDGFSTNFQLRHPVFQGTSSNLLQDDWSEGSFAQGTWIVNDPTGVIFLVDANGNPIGALNVAQAGLPGVYVPQVNATYIQAQNGLELGGGLNLQHGQITFNDACNGIIGALYGTSTFLPGNVLAGFGLTGQRAVGALTVTSVQIPNGNSNIVWLTVGTQPNLQPGNVLTCAGFVAASFLNGTKLQVNGVALDPSGTTWTITCRSASTYLNPYGPTADSGTVTAVSNDVIITASGAAGVVIQPMFSGTFVGPRIISQINHQYVLQTWVGAEAPTRYTRPYTNINRSNTYGNQFLTASGTVTFVVTDIDIGAYVIEQQNPLFGLFPAAPPPVVTKFIVPNASLPPFALYCLLNAINLNISLNYTDLSLPPQGFLTVQSLTGASGGTLPWKPQQLSPPITYQLGFGMINQTAQIGQQGEAYALQFYTDDIPSVGARIRFQSWAAGESIARVVDSVAISVEASISGDDGVRSAIMNNLSPIPRTSDECEAAAAAAIIDREFPQFQGTYTIETVPLRFRELFDPASFDYPKSGEYFYVNAPSRGVVAASGVLLGWQNNTFKYLVQLIDNIGGLSAMFHSGVVTGFVRGDYIFVFARLTGGPGQSTPLNIHDSGGHTWTSIGAIANYGVWYTRAQSGGTITVQVDNTIDTANPGAGYQFMDLFAGVVDQGFNFTSHSYLNLSSSPLTTTFAGAQFVIPVFTPSGNVTLIALTDSNSVVQSYICFNDKLASLPTTPAGFIALNSGLDESRLGYLSLSVGTSFLVNTARVRVLELREEVMNISLDYGPDLYLERLLPAFLERDQNVLTPKDTVAPPNPVDISQVLNAHLDTLASAQVTQIVNSLTGNYITVDLGVLPATGCEVRNVDDGWGIANQGRVGFFTTQTFTLPRTIRDQTWYLREVNGGIFSRFSKALRVVYPLIPSAPGLVSASSSSAVFAFAGDVRDVYGLEVRATPTPGTLFYQFPTVPENTVAQFDRESLYVPTDQNTVGNIVRNNGNVLAVYNPPSNTAPFSFPYQYQLGDIIYTVCPGDTSFNGFHVLSGIQAASGSTGAVSPTSIVAIYNTRAYIFDSFNSGYAGGFALRFPLNPASAIYSSAVSSLMFNNYGGAYRGLDPNLAPMQVDIRDQNSKYIGPQFLPGTIKGYYMVVSGAFVVPAGGNYSFRIDHDDGMFWGIGGGATRISGPNINPAAQVRTPINGYPLMGANNQSGYWQDYYVVNFPAPGLYPFEIAYAQWYNEQTLQVTCNGLLIPPTPNTTFIQATSGSPWGFEWFDYEEPYPDTIGVVQYGVNNQVGTAQLLFRGPYALMASGAIAASYDGTATITTQTPHGLTAGGQAIISAGWATWPVAGYPSLPHYGTPFCGIQNVLSTPTTTSFTIKIAEFTDPSTLIPGTWQEAVARLGVPAQLLNGVVAPMPTPFNLANSSGILVQRPVFAPSDLVVDFTQPDIAEALGVLQALSPGGVVGGLTAYFFNLTWDYSAATPIPSFSVPAITGVFINDQTQQIQWAVSQGVPNGYRVIVTDLTGQMTNTYTIDHPYNTFSLQSLQMTPTDYNNPRIFKITPFNAIGNGQPVTVFHSASGGGIYGSTQIFAECLDVRNFGAVGDGITDDTGAIQGALDTAYQNTILQKTSGQLPTQSPTIVCIPSNIVCKVTPQFLDAAPASVGGYGPTAVALTIGSGVTLRIDGEIALAAPSNPALLSVPWVVLENFNAYSQNLGIYGYGDTEIVIEGNGILSCSGSGGGIKFENVSNSVIKDIYPVQYSTFGIHLLNSNGVTVKVFSTGTTSQNSVLVLVDKCTGVQVIGGTVKGGSSFVWDYGSNGTLIDCNTVYNLSGYYVRHVNQGFEDGLPGKTYTGLAVSNNFFASGLLSTATVVSINGATGVSASGGLDYGLILCGNTIVNCAGSGVVLANVRYGVIQGNVINGNALGIGRLAGSLLVNVAILDNTIALNTIDMPVYSALTSPIYRDGTSTCTIYNPQVDRLQYFSWAPQAPVIMGVSPSGQSGFVSPPALPNTLYGVGLSATGFIVSGAVLAQVGTSLQVVILPFKIIWPDLTLTYSGTTLTAPAVGASGGYGSTWFVFVDDPYRDASNRISYGMSLYQTDLATSAGRYYLGSVVFAPGGSGTIGLGGFLPGSTAVNFADNETPLNVSGNIVFTLAHVPNPAGSLLLFIQGQLQTQGAGLDYTLVGNKITLLALTIQPGDNFRAWYRY